MNETEQRRRELLHQTRKLYEDRNPFPAVHPRYGNICHYLYRQPGEPSEDEKKGSGGFCLRLIAGILCFLCFIYADQSSAPSTETTCSRITELIREDGEEIDSVLAEVVSQLGR